MRILLSWQKCVVGGVETWMVGLARALHMLGHECELFFFERGPFAEFVPPDVPAHFGGLYDLLSLVDARGFDVVQAASLDWDCGVTAVRALGAKLVIHGNGWVHEAWNAGNCDAMVACAKWNARAQQPLTDLPVQVIANGIALERFPLAEFVGDGAPVVAWIGRGSDLRQKRIDQLAAVAPLLHAAGLRLWVADPDGPERVPAEIAARLRPHAQRWEKVPPQEMPAFYRAVAASGGCILSTSRFEGLSLAYLEGQACGCPLIGPNVIGVNESCDPQRGGTLYPEDLPAAELAKLVCGTLGDREKMAWRRKASRAFVEEHCNFATTARQYVQVYQDAPCPPLRTWAGFRARTACWPMIDWSKYADYRWGVASQCYQLSERFLAEGKTAVARALLRQSFRLAPTMFLRARRLRYWRQMMRTQPGTMVKLAHEVQT